ncbi:phage shock protein A [Alicyclobacillaceae bacterium I2511]|nr:phage shock protein A [Alicyclobacillaceae bacterium I2511]
MMSLFSRIKDIARANLNDLVNKAEDPEKSLNLYIEDASEQLRQFAVEVNRFEAEKLRTEQRIRDSKRAADEWHEKARLAIEQSREDLARQALEQEKKERERVSQLEPEQAEAEKTSSELKEQYEQLQTKLTDAKERRDDLVRRNRRALAEKGVAEALSGVNQEDPLSKFDRMEEKVMQREAEAKVAYGGMTSSLDYEFDQLKKQQEKGQVDDALAKLKEEMGKQA